MTWRIVKTRKLDKPPNEMGLAWKVYCEADDGRSKETVVSVVETLTASDRRGWPEDVQRATQTQGKSAVKDALAEGGDPPARITCSTEGCRAATG